MYICIYIYIYIYIHTHTTTTTTTEIVIVPLVDLYVTSWPCGLCTANPNQHVCPDDDT